MWKTLLAALIRFFAPRLIEKATSALDKELAPLPPTDGTDFGTPPKVKIKRRRTLLEMYEDAQSQLIALQATNHNALSPREQVLLAQRIQTQLGEVARYKARLDAQQQNTIN